MHKFIEQWAIENPVQKHRFEFLIRDVSDDCALAALYVLKPELNNYNVSTVTRTTEQGFHMRLHRDNYHVQKNPPVTGRPIFTFERHTEIDPEFVMVLYYSDHVKDFKGGVFQFSDGTQIKPKRGLCSVFHANDVHEVTLQTSGIRKITLFTFRPKNCP